jgi:energy-coupling factor transporter ATP-binding protein EcfA2
MICGYAGAGKSTVARHLQSLLPSSERLSFAQFVKDRVDKMYDIDRSLCDTQEGKNTIVEATHGIFKVRDLLIIHAESHKRKYGDGVWAEAVAEQIKSRPEIHDWILEDWRFPVEYTVLRETFRSALIHRFRVRNDNVKPYNNAEKAMDTEPMHAILDNTNQNQSELLVQLAQEIL